MRNETQKKRTTTRLLCLLGVAALFTTGCPGAKDDAKDAGAQRDSGETGNVDPTDDAGVAARDAATNKDGGVKIAADGATIDDEDAAGDDAMVSAEGPSLTAVSARQVGRFGGDVEFSVTGKAVVQNALSLRVRLFSSTNDDIALADIDGDGSLDTGDVEFPLSAAITRAGGEASVLIRGVGAANSDIARAVVALVDDQGVPSEEMDIDVVSQMVLSSGDACDKKYRENRCGAALGCKGSPAACSASEAPSVDAASRYLDDSLGARILIIGDDADDDISNFHLRYLDGSGNPVNVNDTDGNGTPDSAVADGMVDAIGANGSVFISSMLTPNASLLVLKVEVTLSDRADNVGVPVVISKTTPTPTVAAGGNCDMRLLNRCATNNVCVPTAPGATTGKCTATSSARTKACASALVLNPAKGITDVRGQIALPSLWDTPNDCSANNPKFRPEQLVKLTLANDAARVTVSSHHPYTSIDSTLYVLTSCTGEARVGQQWCGDDIFASEPHTEQAELVLENLTKGDYYIVVDSYLADPITTAFELSVEVE